MSLLPKGRLKTHHADLVLMRALLMVVLPFVQIFHCDALAASEPPHSIDGWPNVNYAFPYLSYNATSFIYSPSIVSKGVIISNDFTSSNLKFIPWGQHHLRINNVTIFGKPFLRIYGNTGSTASGITSGNLNFQGRYISIILGNSSTIPYQERQISFQITLENKGNTYKLVFVNGPLSIFGWHGNTYYQKIDPLSSMLLDLYNMVPVMGVGQQLHVSRIDIVVQKYTNINSFEFIIYPGKITESLPALVPGGGRYFVHGTLARAADSIDDLKYFIHDLAVRESVTLKFINFPKESTLKSNNWNIIGTSQSFQHSELNDNRLTIKADRLVDLNNLSFQTLQKLDLAKTIASLGSKDFLLIIVLVGSFVSIYLEQSHKRQISWRYRRQ